MADEGFSLAEARAAAEEGRRQQLRTWQDFVAGKVRDRGREGGEERQRGREGGQVHGAVGGAAVVVRRTSTPLRPLARSARCIWLGWVRPMEQQQQQLLLS